MSGYLIDTNWVIDVINGRSSAGQTLDLLRPSGLAVSLISYGELYEGAYYAKDRANALAGVADFLSGVPILLLSDVIMETFGIVRGTLPRHVRQQIGDMDLLIAATALTHDLTLLTRNLRDFEHVPGLSLYRSD